MYMYACMYVCVCVCVRVMFSMYETIGCILVSNYLPSCEIPTMSRCAEKASEEDHYLCSANKLDK